MDEAKEQIIAGLERNLENLKRELEGYSEQLVNQQMILDANREEIEIRERMIPLMDKCKRLNPNLEFETDEEYVALDAQLAKLSLRGKVFQLKQQAKNAERVVENARTEVERISKAIPEAERQLAEARGE